jgi:murein DD-endopeptidase MepM/ murein hydrolase activator NlpD
MKGWLPDPRRVMLHCRVRSLLLRFGLAVVLVTLAWGALQLGGVTSELTHNGVEYLLNRHYNLAQLADKLVGTFQKRQGLDVKVSTLPGTGGSGTRLELPVTGDLVRGFGWQKNSDGWPRYNEGIELRVTAGSMVRAVLPGKVVRVVSDQALGKVVIIEHSQDCASLYGRLGEVKVKNGDQVVQGDFLGTSTAYLHFEWREVDRLVDPVQRFQQGI